MADSKLSELPEDAAPTLDDLLLLVNDPAGTPASRQATLDKVLDAAIGAKFATITGGGREKFHTQDAVSGAVTVDLADANEHVLNLGGDVTGITWAGFTAGLVCLATVEINQDGTGGHSADLSSVDEWNTADGNPPTMPTAANASLTILVKSRDGGVTLVGYAADDGLSPVTVEDITATTHTPAAGDANSVKRCTDGSGCTVTLPTGLPVGTLVEYIAWGAGGVTFQDDGSSTVQPTGSIAQYEAASALVVATDTWHVAGPVA